MGNKNTYFKRDSGREKLKNDNINQTERGQKKRLSDENLFSLCTKILSIYNAGKQALTTNVIIKIAHAGPSMWESVPLLMRFVSASQMIAAIVPNTIAMITAIHIFPVVL